MSSSSYKITGHLHKAAGKIKIAVGTVLGSEQLLVKGASQQFKGEEQIAAAATKDRLKAGGKATPKRKL